MSEQTGECMKAGGKQIQLFYLCWKSVLNDKFLPGYSDVSGLELPPEDNLTICTLQTHSIHRVTLETSLSFYSTFMVMVNRIDGCASFF